jgi:hypothetical protein
VVAMRIAAKFASSESFLCHGLDFEGLHDAHGVQTQADIAVARLFWIRK